jgi:hypothetical protein
MRTAVAAVTINRLHKSMILYKYEMPFHTRPRRVPAIPGAHPALRRLDPRRID